MPLPEFLWPPRPEKAVMPSAISFYEGQGFVAQYKKNGTCVVLFFDGQGGFRSKNRHNEEVSNWSMSRELASPFLNDRVGEAVFTVELLHSKVSNGPKNTLYVFDVIHLRGESLVGVTFEERQRLLNEAMSPKDYGIKSHSLVTERVWVAKNHRTGLKRLFDGISSPEDEGLVLKNPRSKLKPCGKSGLNSGWQVKSRVWNKNYSY